MISTGTKIRIIAALALYAVAATGAAVWSAGSVCRRVREVRRLKANQTALMEDVECWRTKDGKRAAETRKLELSVEEYRSALEASESVREGQRRTIESLSLKVRRLESVRTTAMAMSLDTVTSFVTEKARSFGEDTLKPSGSVRGGNAVSPVAGSVEWRDPWVSVSVRVAADGRADVRLASADTLYQVAHRIPRRFLGIPYGTKAVRQVVTGCNPHSRITYSEIIEIRK